MTFEPGIHSDAARGKIFAISGANLALFDGDAQPDDVYLGALDGEPCFARLAMVDGAMPLRQLFGALPEETFAVAGRALGLTAWDRDHKHCGRCGTPTARSTEERVRTCPACKFTSYPRLSPAVIMLVEKDGKALLARNARTKMPFSSTLAGFVEVGETLEDTVHREIREGVGIEVADVRYFGSQPWPFTSSLMVAFTARWERGELAPDGREILEADWFARDQLPVVPPPLSIARRLIDDFVTMGV
jgi:NAD+ diphosphatase